MVRKLILASFCLVFTASFAQDRRGRGERPAYQRSTKQDVPEPRSGSKRLEANGIVATFANDGGDWTLDVAVGDDSCEIDHFWWFAWDHYKGSCETDRGTVEATVSHASPNAYGLWIRLTPREGAPLEASLSFIL